MIVLLLMCLDDAVLHSVKSMGPAAVELELSLLYTSTDANTPSGPSATTSQGDATGPVDAAAHADLMLSFIEFLSYLFSAKQDVDLASSYLGLLLKVG